MNAPRYADWLESLLPRQHRLTNAVTSILENLLQEDSIEYLAVSGRTKDVGSALEKIKRKGYTDPQRQLTDLSGIRIVVFFESDVRRAAKLIEDAFTIDRQNSLNKDAILPTNQIGYRSVHYVCDLGIKRSTVDEYRTLAGLKFEIQIRTVLQHAWAELAHDRNYKFSGKLPQALERQLFLYAGLLEIADRGFDETAKAVDEYAKSLPERASKGDPDLEVTSLSLTAFVDLWCRTHDFKLTPITEKNDLGDLVEELHQFGITRIAELSKIVPHRYAEIAKSLKFETTIYGVVRDWMLIHDWRRFMNDVHFTWVMDPDEILGHFLPDSDYQEMMGRFAELDHYDEDDDAA